MAIGGISAVTGQIPSDLRDFQSRRGVVIEGGSRLLMWREIGSRLTIATASSVADLLVMVDGRIDNAAELWSFLEKDDDDDEVEGTNGLDALVAAGYRYWGRTVFQRLIGDWAIALYDRASDLLLLARDYPGVRPLYYSQRSGNLIWASDIEGICRSVKDLALDQDYLRQYMVSYSPSTRTPYRHISQLDGGSLLAASRSSARVEQFYRPLNGLKQTTASADELATEFRTLLHTAVADRTSPSARGVAELSGGLDSSSIVCLAGEIWAQEDRDHGSLVTVTYGSDDSVSCLDRKYASEVNRCVKFKNVFVNDEVEGALLPLKRQASLTLWLPDCEHGRHAALARVCKEQGASYMLCGSGGDAIGWSTRGVYPILADLWCAGEIRALWRELRDAGRSLRRSVWDLWWNDCIRLSRRIARAPLRPDLQPFAIWMRGAPSLPLPMPIAELEQLPPSVRVFHWIVELSRYPLLANVFHALEPAYYVAYPFMDRRLIEFAYRVPTSQKVKHNQSRIIHRLALKDTLPASVVTRESKSHMSTTLERDVVRASAVFEGPECLLADYGVVDVDVIRRVLAESSRHGAAEALIPLCRTVALESWLRTREGLDHSSVDSSER